MLSARQQHCLTGMGITHWRERSELVFDKPPLTEVSRDFQSEAETRPASKSAAAAKPATRPVVDATQTRREFRTYPVDDWEQTLASIDACQNCSLGSGCTRKVPGKGNPQADLMIIGEAPGRDEDLQGLPFVGRAGQLLDKMLKAIGLQTEQVYITNILKCRPPNNRDPQPEEVVACSQFLNAQIKLLQPKVLLSVGRISAQNLLKLQQPLGKLRQSQHCLPETNLPLLVTYHPAYLLRNPADKSKAWEDLKNLNRLLHGGS